MLFNTLAASSLLVASALAVAEPAPYKLGSMSFNNAFGLNKRQSGYEPTQTYCGPGTDCASSCGTGFIQCASTDDNLHCFNPTVKQSCCPDGSGNSCDDGYFCTSDSTGGTWCCPDGMSLAACAAAYSLTGSLVSETAAPTVVVPSSTPASASASASTTPAAATTSSGAYVPVSTYTSTSSYSVSTYAVIPTTTSSASKNSSATTSSAPLQVTNAAAHVAYAGLPALALAAGAFLAL